VEALIVALALTSERFFTPRRSCDQFDITYSLSTNLNNMCYRIP
jgi:hypothetical protein